jgi:protein tyrosine phosphatase (PTP) superfamily phosphohydrolase (DUF442 family)
VTYNRRQIVLGLCATTAGMALPFGAQAVERLSVAGVDNLFLVTDRLYRSAQPTKEGFSNLAKDLGIKTIISLREFHSDEKLALNAGLVLQRVPINSWNIGDDKGEKLVRAIRLIRAAETSGRVLVHCQHGSDRTGAIIALYKMLYLGQDREEAIKEMMEGGFGFHPIWAVLPEWGNIPAALRRLDLQDVKRRVEVM